MAFQLVKEPYLEQLRVAVSEFKKVVDEELDDAVIGRAWASFDKVKEALSQLCPNHPQIMMHL